MSQDKETRHMLRLPVATRVRIKGQGSQDILLTKNMSMGGLFLAAEDPPYAGSILEMEISLPNTESLLTLKAEVIWRQQGTGCGVRFTRITAAQKKILAAFLADLDVDDSPV